MFSALEIVGSRIAKIGNALKKWGLVSERAFEWMNPDANFQNKFFIALEKNSDRVSDLEMVTMEVSSIQDSANELAKQQLEFEQHVKGINPEDNRPKDWEHDARLIMEEKSKKDTKVLDIKLSELGHDEE
jgi:signal recognition particle subunit SEC65